MTLPSGPRYTYPIPSTVEPGSRELARQMLATVRAEIAAKQEVRTGLMTTGCDGLPVINPLDGTTCNGDGGTQVLFNPQTRKVIGTLGKPATGLAPKVTAVLPASCEIVRANLRAKRRFVDDLGNMYGPDGEWLGHSYAPAELETEYVHRFEQGRVFTLVDSGEFEVLWPPWQTVVLAKSSGVSTSLALTSGGRGTLPPPTINDIVSAAQISTYEGLPPGVPLDRAGLDDALFGGVYDDFQWRGFYEVEIDGVGTPDTFSVAAAGPYDSGPYTSVMSHIPITGAEQPLAHGVTVTFGATTGHRLHDSWSWIKAPGNRLTRLGIGARGTLATPNECINGGFPNTNVLVTSEDDIAGTSHAIVVRDADSLALLYRKALAHDGTSYAFASPGQKFSFSTNDEGLFFLHCYTTPTLASPPTPFPGAEFGAPNPRKIAVISVDPLTFEPTIEEVITLEDKTYTAGSTFAVGATLPWKRVE